MTASACSGTVNSSPGHPGHSMNMPFPVTTMAADSMAASGLNGTGHPTPRPLDFNGQGGPGLVVPSACPGWPGNGGGMKRIAALLLALAAGTAVGQDRWQYVGDGSSNESSIFMDTSSLRRNGDYSDAWFESRFEIPKKYSRISNFYRINCKERTLISRSYVEYKPDGSVLNSSSNAGAFEPIVPRSIGERLWGAACPDEAAPQGLEDVASLGRRLRALDEDFDKKLQILAPKIQHIQANYPPTTWAEAIEYEYRKLP